MTALCTDMDLPRKLSSFRYTSQQLEKECSRYEQASYFPKQVVHNAHLLKHSISLGADEVQSWLDVSPLLEQLEEDQVYWRNEVSRLEQENATLKERTTYAETQRKLVELKLEKCKQELSEAHYQIKLLSTTTPIAPILDASSSSSMLPSPQKSPSDVLQPRSALNGHHTNLESASKDSSSSRLTESLWDDMSLVSSLAPESSVGLPVNSIKGIPLPPDCSCHGNATVEHRVASVHQLAMEYVSQGSLDMAFRLYQTTIKQLWQEHKLCSLHVAGSPDLAKRLEEELAGVYSCQGYLYKECRQYVESVTSLKESLRLRERVHSPVHSTVASLLNNIAILYSKLNQFPEAELLCQKALGIKEKLFPDPHIELVRQHFNLALLYRHMSDWHRSAHEFLTCSDMHLRFNPPNSWKSCVCSAHAAQNYVDAGDLLHALQVFERLASELNLLRRSTSSSQSGSSDSSNSKYSLHHSSGIGSRSTWNRTECLRLLRQCGRTLPGPESWADNDTRSLYAWVLAHLSCLYETRGETQQLARLMERWSILKGQSRTLLGHQQPSLVLAGKSSSGFSSRPLSCCSVVQNSGLDMLSEELPVPATEVPTQVTWGTNTLPNQVLRRETQEHSSSSKAVLPPSVLRRLGHRIASKLGFQRRLSGSMFINPHPQQTSLAENLDATNRANHLLMGTVNADGSRRTLRDSLRLNAPVTSMDALSVEHRGPLLHQSQHGSPVTQFGGFPTSATFHGPLMGANGRTRSPTLLST